MCVTASEFLAAGPKRRPGGVGLAAGCGGYVRGNFRTIVSTASPASMTIVNSTATSTGPITLLARWVGLLATDHVGAIDAAVDYSTAGYAVAGPRDDGRTAAGTQSCFTDGRASPHSGNLHTLT